jgi:arylsulfatase A-like enzyme
VEALLATLQQHRLLDKTLLVIASDHGESFREHGFEGHAKTLYTEVIDTPLVVMLPFRLEKGVVVEERVENIDIFPTVLDLLGLPPLPGAQGVSLVPAIRAAAASPGGAEPELANWAGRTSYSHLDRTWGTPEAEPNPFVAVTDGPWRYIHVARHPERSELYDHRSDPGEQKNLLADQPEIAASLRAKADEFFSLPAAPFGRATEVQLDRLRLEQLRALGYDVGEGEAILPGAERDLRDLQNRPPSPPTEPAP